MFPSLPVVITPPASAAQNLWQPLAPKSPSVRALLLSQRTSSEHAAMRPISTAPRSVLVLQSWTAVEFVLEANQVCYALPYIFNSRVETSLNSVWENRKGSCEFKGLLGRMRRHSQVQSMWRMRGPHINRMEQRSQLLG